VQQPLDTRSGGWLGLDRAPAGKVRDLNVTIPGDQLVDIPWR